MNRQILHRMAPDRVRLLLGGLAVALALGGCGGGGGEPVAVLAEAEQAPPTLTLAQPRHVTLSDRIALAWTSEDFSGSIVARLEAGLSSAVVRTWALQHNGPGVTTDHAWTPFELRYADGFFLLTSLQAYGPENNDALFGIAVYPGDVAPTGPRYDFFSFDEWPKGEGETLSLLIPRNEPDGFTYSVLLRRSEREEFRTVAEGIVGQTAVIERGIARTLDFPTARVKVRGCRANGECLESAEQPLLPALLGGVRSIQPLNDASTQVALSADGNMFVTAYHDESSGRRGWWGHYRDENRRWGRSVNFHPAPGLGRRLALAGDGSTVAVEASPCPTTTEVCDASTVYVFGRNGFGGFKERARLEGVREPRLSHDGRRLAAISTGTTRGDAALVFVREGDAWREEALPPVGHAALDIALSADGLTLAIARRGSADDPCGCRSVLIYRYSGANGWRYSGELRPEREGPSRPIGDDGFGYAQSGARNLALSADGAVVAVGASRHTADAALPQSGAIHVFERAADGAWQRQALLRPLVVAPSDRFGHHVALSADGRLLYGAARGLAADAAGVNRNHDAADAPGAAVYVFERDGPAAWVQRASVVPPGADRVGSGQLFDIAVNADGSTLVLGTAAPDEVDAPAEPGPAERTLFVY